MPNLGAPMGNCNSYWCKYHGIISSLSHLKFSNTGGKHGLFEYLLADYLQVRPLSSWPIYHCLGIYPASCHFFKDYNYSGLFLVGETESRSEWLNWKKKSLASRIPLGVYSTAYFKNGVYFELPDCFQTIFNLCFTQCASTDGCLVQQSVSSIKQTDAETPHQEQWDASYSRLC